MATDYASVIAGIQQQARAAAQQKFADMLRAGEIFDAGPGEDGRPSYYMAGGDRQAFSLDDLISEFEVPAMDAYVKANPGTPAAQQIAADLKSMRDAAHKGDFGSILHGAAVSAALGGALGGFGVDGMSLADAVRGAGSGVGGGAGAGGGVGGAGSGLEGFANNGPALLSPDVPGFQLPDVVPNVTQSIAPVGAPLATGAPGLLDGLPGFIKDIPAGLSQGVKAINDAIKDGGKVADLGLSLGASTLATKLAGGGSGGETNAADAQAADEARKAGLRKSVNNALGLGDDAAANSYFATEKQRLGDATRSYYTDELNRGYTKAEREARQALAGRGLTGSSVMLEDMNRLKTDQALGVSRVDDAVRKAMADLESSRQSAADNAYGLISGGAGDDAVSAATAGLKNSITAANTAPRQSIVTGLFEDLAANKLLSQAAGQQNALWARYNGGKSSSYFPTKGSSGTVYSGIG